METSVETIIIFIDEFQVALIEAFLLFNESFSLCSLVASFSSDFMNAVVPPSIIPLLVAFVFEEVMLLAGTRTLSTSLEWAVCNLMNHPAVIRKAREELDTQIARDHLVD
ncbi:hypothetical protein DKX38_013504 [Salix brachista]|uniref:Uncharacterized protein n=1 Tax=Salix brachista TaxID=2182728 RepID=A0A5N5LS20_9ROSI|nr:hypothetical protein DKX38_013504 [Salix brachista]